LGRRDRVAPHPHQRRLRRADRGGHDRRAGVLRGGRAELRRRPGAGSAEALVPPVHRRWDRAAAPPAVVAQDRVAAAAPSQAGRAELAAVTALIADGAGSPIDQGVTTVLWIG